ncbi:uncharacterized protein LOC116779858 [Danaus plexippus]|uniref:uncharacterized protein LOC116779858 n=1 Tax=Danaus plexippus TaxID=13037 RepID=UPI002AB226F5|nr:uncharacterized protein LOC116779858 [Danaus plexippus]
MKNIEGRDQFECFCHEAGRWHTSLLADQTIADNAAILPEDTSPTITLILHKNNALIHTLQASRFAINTSDIGLMCRRQRQEDTPPHPTGCLRGYRLYIDIQSIQLEPDSCRANQT